MSYQISCLESDFTLVKPKAALAALKDANRRAPFFASYDEVAAAIENARTLGGAFRACEWEVELEAGKISKLFYEGNLLGDFEDDIVRLFRVLAPFVRSGSFLEITGDDGAYWRLEFRRGRLKIRDRE